ncbi:MAG: phosphohydrolase [Magnetococcales bacterium]|nr:phosphohydrolase [Magnetococcales bacterium]
MAEVREGAWIQTYTGRQFWPMDARPEEVEIRDIAHALSMLCRFNGHCTRYYSVAEHAVHVSRVVEARYARWGLLHDAAEAYLSDLPKPIKRLLPEYHIWEGRLLAVIAQRFFLETTEVPQAVMAADLALLATEKVVLMQPEPAPWMDLPRPVPGLVIHAWSPEEAKQAFLARFMELYPDWPVAEVHPLDALPNS